MVKKDWDPAQEADPEAPMDGYPLQLCVKGCCRPRAEGTDGGGRPYDTCCRGCGKGEAHDDECDDQHKGRLRVVKQEFEDTQDVYEGGETKDWTWKGWFILVMYNVTVILLMLLAFVIPVLTAYPPFNRAHWQRIRSKTQLPQKRLEKIHLIPSPWLRTVRPQGTEKTQLNVLELSPGFEKNKC